MSVVQNEHALKIQLVESDEQYQNKHPLKVTLVGTGIEVVDKLPSVGMDGIVYVLVDNLEHPTSSKGTYIWSNGWVMTSQGQSIQVVDHLPQQGEEGVIYYVKKEGEDTYDLYCWLENQWRKLDADVILYSTSGQNTNGAMTQKATTDYVGERIQPAEEKLSGIESGAQVNVIESISVNDVPQDPDGSKNINIDTPDIFTQDQWNFLWSI